MIFEVNYLLIQLTNNACIDVITIDLALSHKYFPSKSPRQQPAYCLPETRIQYFLWAAKKTNSLILNRIY